MDISAFINSIYDFYTKSWLYRSSLSHMPYPFNGVNISFALLINFIFLMFIDFLAFIDLVHTRKLLAGKNAVQTKKIKKNVAKDKDDSKEAAVENNIIEESVPVDVISDYQEDSMVPEVLYIEKTPEDEHSEDIPAEDLISFDDIDMESETVTKNGLAEILEKISKQQENQQMEESKKEQNAKEHEENAARLDEEIKAKFKTDKASRKVKVSLNNQNVPSKQGENGSISFAGKKKGNVIKDNTVCDIDIL